MRIDILTLFPDSVGDVLSESIIGRAQERGIVRIEEDAEGQRRAWDPVLLRVA